VVQKINCLIGKKGVGLDKFTRRSTFVDFITTGTLILGEARKLVQYMRFEDAYDQVCKGLSLLSDQRDIESSYLRSHLTNVCISSAIGIGTEKRLELALNVIINELKFKQNNLF
jgi:hypothetical protein